MGKEKKMIYCRLLSKNKKIISYSIGAVISDITGEIKIDIDGKRYEIIKQPQKEEVYPLFINKMLWKYRGEFNKGIIPEKMSYEI